MSKYGHLKVCCSTSSQNKLFPALARNKKIYAEHGSESPSITNTSIYRSRDTGSPRPKVSRAKKTLEIRKLRHQKRRPRLMYRGRL